MPSHVTVKKLLETGVQEEQAGVEQLRRGIANRENHSHAVLNEEYLMGRHWKSLPLQ